jgi:hypothetical protein
VKYQNTLERELGSLNRGIRYQSFGSIYYSTVPFTDLGYSLKNYNYKEELSLKRNHSLYYVLVFYSLVLVFMSSMVMLGGYYSIVYILLAISFWLCYGTTDIVNNFYEVYERRNLGGNEYYCENFGERGSNLNEGYLEYDDLKNENFYHKDSINISRSSTFSYDFEICSFASFSGKSIFEEPAYFKNWLLSTYDISVNKLVLKKIEYSVFNDWRKELSLDRFKSNYRFINSFFLKSPSQVSFFYRYELYLFVFSLLVYSFSGGLCNLYNSFISLYVFIFNIFDFFFSIVELFITVFQCEESHPIPILLSSKLILPIDYLDMFILVLDFIGDYFLTFLFIIILVPKLLLWFYFYIWMR